MAAPLQAAHPATAELLDRRTANKNIKQLDEARHTAVEQLKACAYTHRQIVWLQERFPKAEMQDVAGLCKVVRRLEPDPRPLRGRSPGRGGRRLRLRTNPARHPCGAGRLEPRGGGTGGEDSGQL